MKTVWRREFLKNVATAGTGLVVGGALASNAFTPSRVNAQQRFSWRMTTVWPPGFPILQEGAERFARLVETMTQGRLQIRVFAAGELLPPLGGFDAVRTGTIEVNYGVSFFWAGVVPQAQFFTIVPFGMTLQQTNAWLFSGGGLELWREVYRPFNMTVFPIAQTGMGMAGWFRKEIREMKDFEGLKMRIPGLAARALAKAGVTTILVPPGEIFTALERGVVDAAEFVAPFHDLRLGLHRAASFYYYPGWHEPSSVAELTINLTAWNRLPQDIQAAVEAAALEVYQWSAARFDVLNAQALREIQASQGVRVRRLPTPVLRQLRRYSLEVLEEEAAKNPDFKRVSDAYTGFRRQLGNWTAISEEAVISMLQLR